MALSGEGGPPGASRGKCNARSGVPFVFVFCFKVDLHFPYCQTALREEGPGAARFRQHQHETGLRGPNFQIRKKMPLGSAVSTTASGPANCKRLKRAAPHCTETTPRDTNWLDWIDLFRWDSHVAATLAPHPCMGASSSVRPSWRRSHYR